LVCSLNVEQLRNVDITNGGLSLIFICKKTKLEKKYKLSVDCLCGLVVRVLGYRSGGPGSILGTTRKIK
jgi:hypothetical protein